MSTSSTSEVRISGSRDLSAIYERFGKADLVASIVGMLTALGTFVFMSALFAAGAASISYQPNLINSDGNLDEASILGIVVAAAVVFVAFVVGGFAAGRIARYSGGLNGFGAGLWAILLITTFAALGAWIGAEYNAFANADLPNWVAQIDADTATTTAIVASSAMVLMTLLGGYIGGRLGELYHHRVDAAIVETTTRKEV